MRSNVRHFGGEGFKWNRILCMQKLLVCKYSDVNLNPLWFTMENTDMVFFTWTLLHTDWRQRRPCVARAVKNFRYETKIKFLSVRTDNYRQTHAHAAVGWFPRTIFVCRAVRLVVSSDLWPPRSGGWAELRPPPAVEGRFCTAGAHCSGGKESTLTEMTLATFCTNPNRHLASMCLRKEVQVFASL